MALDANSRANILKSIKKLVLAHHINVSVRPTTSFRRPIYLMQ